MKSSLLNLLADIVIFGAKHPLACMIGCFFVFGVFYLGYHTGVVLTLAGHQ